MSDSLRFEYDVERTVIAVCSVFVRVSLDTYVLAFEESVGVF